MNKKGLLVVFSGPSGCGKGTVMKELLFRNSDIFLSVSATTRSPRAGEIDGAHYYFLSKEKFEELIAADGMLEYACYCDNYYGTPKAAVEEQLNQGNDVILEIEVQGAMQIMERYPEAVGIFILPPSMEELEKRLVGRNTEQADVIAKRLAQAKAEMLQADQYDYVVVNDNVDDTAREIEAILTAEKLKKERMKQTISEIVDSI